MSRSLLIPLAIGIATLASLVFASTASAPLDEPPTLMQILPTDVPSAMPTTLPTTRPTVRPTPNQLLLWRDPYSKCWRTDSADNLILQKDGQAIPCGYGAGVENRPYLIPQPKGNAI